MHDYSIKYEPKADSRMQSLGATMRQQIQTHVDWYVAGFLCATARRNSFKVQAPISRGPFWTTYSGPYRIVMHRGSDPNVISVVEIEPYGNRVNIKLRTRGPDWKITFNPQAVEVLQPLEKSRRQRLLDDLQNFASAPGIWRLGRWQGNGLSHAVSLEQLVAVFDDTPQARLLALIERRGIHTGLWRFYSDGYTLICHISNGDSLLEILQADEAEPTHPAVTAAEGTWRIKIPKKTEAAFKKLDSAAQTQLKNDLHGFIIPVIQIQDGSRLPVWEKTLRSGGLLFTCIVDEAEKRMKIGKY